jgi:peptide-methionine (S)-S-oxide reductase
MKRNVRILFSLIIVLLMNLSNAGFTQKNGNMESNSTEKATLGAGCFWCVEAVYQQLKGVKSVTSGYAGGHVKNPSYKEVTNGNTGHAEVVQIQFDPKIISYSEILDVFWKTHDPTTLNRQGPDIGPQYRSVIFYHNEKQKQMALESKEKMDQSGYYRDPIVTKIEPYQNFYVAEDYHQDFYKNNPNQPYCKFNIDPKMEKLQQQFGKYLR